jgi:hypothetical protein
MRKGKAPWNQPLAQGRRIPVKFRPMPHRLTALGPRHHAAIRMKIDGASGIAIAEGLGVELRTVYLWMSDPLVKEEPGRQLTRVDEAFADQLALGAMQGLDALRGLVHGPVAEPIDPRLRLQAACELLDRYQKAAQAHGGDELASLPDEELIERAWQLLTASSTEDIDAEVVER